MPPYLADLPHISGGFQPDKITNATIYIETKDKNHYIKLEKIHEATIEQSFEHGSFEYPFHSGIICGPSEVTVTLKGRFASMSELTHKTEENAEPTMEELLNLMEGE